MADVTISVTVKDAYTDEAKEMIDYFHTKPAGYTGTLVEWYTSDWLKYYMIESWRIMKRLQERDATEASDMGITETVFV